MSAYDKLGLAMIPSGYKGEGDENNAGGFLGKVYSVLPAQTEIDLTDFSHISVQSGNWTIDSINETVTFDGTANGYLFLKGYANLVQPNKTYKVTLTANFTGINYPQFYYGNATGIFLQEGTNTYTLKTNDGLIRINGYGTDSWTISNISIKQVSDGDFDFSRGSDATRVNSQGYIESVQVLSDELVQNGDFEEVGSELITNGGFDTDSDWSFTGNWAISNGVAVGTNEFSYIYQGVGIQPNKVYKITFDVVSITNGFVRPTINGITNVYGDQVLSIGTNTQYLKASSDANGNVSIQGQAFYGSIDNVSVKEVGQNWTFGDGWSITDDGGNLKAIASNSPSGSRLSQFNLGQNINKKHRIYYTVSNLSQGGFNIWFGGITGNNITENGTYYQEIIPTQTTQLFFYNVGTTTGQIDNISVVEITDDTDIPRLDYTNQACPSLLLEPQRRNDIINSEDFTSYLSNASQQADSSASPSNQINAANIYPSSNGIARGVSTSITGTSGVDYTISVFVKSNGKNFVYCTNVNNSSYDVWFDLSNGTISGTGSNNATITNYTNDWYRIAYTSTSTSTTIWSRFLLSDSDGSTSVTVDGTNGVLFYGLQVEQGSYPTSYIPTNGSTVTRLADVCNNAGDSTIFNDAEGVLFAEVSRLNGDSSLTTITLNKGGSEFLGFSFRADGQIWAMTYNGTSSDNLLPYTPTNPYETHKICYKYKSNDFAFWVNGVEVNSSLVDTLTLTGLNELSISGGNSVNKFLGNVRQLLYFNEALSDAELEALTSSNIDRVLKNYNRRGELLGATYESTHVKTKLNELF